MFFRRIDRRLNLSPSELLDFAVFHDRVTSNRHAETAKQRGQKARSVYRCNEENLVALRNDSCNEGSTCGILGFA